MSWVVPLLEAAGFIGEEGVITTETATNIKTAANTYQTVKGTPKKRKKAAQVTPDIPNKKRNINHSHNSNSPILHRRINTGPSTMSTKHQTDEVEVMPVPRNISKSHPEYFSIKMPMFYTWNLTVDSTDMIKHLGIRCNSTYRPFSSGTNPAIRQPLGRDQWAGIYDYYRVISADFNFTFEYVYGYLGSDETGGGVHTADKTPSILVGYQLTSDSTERATSAAAMVEQKHSKAVMLSPTRETIITTVAPSSTVPTQISRKGYSGGSTSMSFHYEPKDWDFHVAETGVEERWTLKGASPLNAHFIMPTIATLEHDGLETNESIKVQVTTYMTYVCQWREVNSTLKRSIDTA